MFPTRYFPSRYFPGTYFPEGSSIEVLETLDESAEGADRAFGAVTPALVYDVAESVEGTDRILYDLVSTFTATIRETAEATERIEYDLAVPIVYSVRENAEISDAGSNADYQVPSGPAMVILTHIYDFFEGDDPFAFSSLNEIAPAHTHYGRVLSWGTSERQIPIPAGPPQLGQMTLEYDDNPDPVTGVQFFRARFGRRTPKGKRIDLLIGPKGGKESLFQIPASGVIEHATFPPGKMRLQINDVRYKWLQKPLPLLINSDNFVNLPAGVHQEFAPFVFGSYSSVGFGNQGALKLIHVDTAQNRYCVACHTVDSVTVYRRATGEQEFSEVTSGYSLVFEDKNIGGLTYNFSFVQFDADQEGAEITADVEGWPFSGGWGSVPPASGVSDNVIEHAITFLYYVDALEKGELRPHDVALAQFDLQSFARVRDQFVDAGYASGYAITQALTPEVILTQMFSTFLIHWFPSRLDKTKVVMTTPETPEDAPIFGDFHAILVKSEMPELAVDTRNQINYNFGLLPATGEWGGQGTYDNEADQALLTDSDGEPIIEAESIDLHACRDADVALLLAAEWSLWRDQDAQRVQFEVDLPKWLSKTELARDFLATHYGGLKEGGWIRERFIPYGLTDDFDALRTRIKAIRRPTVQLPEQQIQTYGVWKLNALVGPWYHASTKHLFEGFVDARNQKKLVALVNDDNGTMIPADDGTFPELANVIGSFEFRRDGDKVYAATQEGTTGRVGYSVFDLPTRLWEVVNQTVIASNSDGDTGVSICVRQPSGDPGIFYQGDRQVTDGSLGQFGAGNWKRGKFRYLSDGSWSSEIDLRDETSEHATFPWFTIYGDPGYYGDFHINVGRCIAEENDSVRFVFSRTEPADVASTPDLQTQILSGANVLSGCYEFQWTGALGYNANFAFGDPCTFTYAGDFYTAVPIGLLKTPKLAIWKSTSAAGAPDYMILLTTVEVQPDTFGAQEPPMSVRWFKNKLHVVFGTRIGSTAEWAAYKTIDPPFSAADPAYNGATARDNQVGPTWPNNTYARHGVEFATIRGQDYMFKVTSGVFGVPDSESYSILEKINLATDVPGDNSYTISNFLDDNS